MGWRGNVSLEEMACQLFNNLVLHLFLLAYDFGLWFSMEL
jgi:hypothetical protein